MEHKEYQLSEHVQMVFFFGSPRTGSTLLGQILNYHPECLIASEFRFLQRLIEKREPEDKLRSELAETAFRHFNNDLTHDGDYKKTLSQYQSKWKDFSDLATNERFSKKEIKILGDKKAGGNAKVYELHKDGVVHYIESKSAKIIHLIRNPYDASLSLIKSHGFENEKVALEYVLNTTSLATEIESKFQNESFYTLFYEDLQKEPQAELAKLCRFLGVNVDDYWLELISSRIESKASNNSIPDWCKQEIESANLNHVFERYF